MMYPRPLLLLLVCFGLALPVFAQSNARSDAENRIYGRLLTTDGDVFEGLIRWDMNEVSWVDVLDGSKRRNATHFEGDRKKRGVRIFGIEWNWEDDNHGESWRLSGLRFGHVRSLENIGRDKALVTLRSGRELELKGGSSDIGNENRGIIVEDTRRGEVELEWRDLERVEFSPAPRNTASRYGERLYGTLTTRGGRTFTGYVCWDVDEVLGDDTLDGDDERDRRRKIAFGDVERIARNSSSSARVTLRDGEEMVLRGTNDVNDENRDILILDPNLGQVRVPWDEFDELRFTRDPAPIGYDDFHGGGPLRGTVYDDAGRSFSGDIRWDDDEAETWEMLNGAEDDVEFDIEFGFVAEIERLSSSAARVTLRDGRVFELRDSNDVSDSNDGILIESKGEVEFLDWDDFARVVFDKP